MTRSLTVVGSDGSRWNDVRTPSAGEQPLERRAGFVVAGDRQQRDAARPAPRRCARRWRRRRGAPRVRAIFTTGTGASGEMRSTSPNQ